MLTDDYVRLSVNEIDRIDCAIFSSDMFECSIDNIHDFKDMLCRWMREIEQKEKFIQEMEEEDRGK
jgi:Fe-S-cluster containining protein